MPLCLLHKQITSFISSLPWLTFMAHNYHLWAGLRPFGSWSWFWKKWLALRWMGARGSKQRVLTGEFVTKTAQKSETTFITIRKTVCCLG